MPNKKPMKKNSKISILTKILISVLVLLLILLSLQLVIVFLGINEANANETTLTTSPYAESKGQYLNPNSAMEHKSRHPQLSMLEQSRHQSPTPAGQTLGVSTQRNKGSELRAKGWHGISSDFDIYDGYAQLYDDLDQDGYYQSFSIVFDPDYYGWEGFANVYGVIYLSQDGGPWMHLYTTEVFTIFADSSDDAYEVSTTLYQDYDSDYYDVLIDLYHVDSDQVVATFSAYDTDALYALGLESQEYDQVYDDEYDHYHGSFSAFSLALMSLVLLLRCARRRMCLIAGN
ncbi:choice-of-anchor H family protein [Thalassotalea aquiviva]|uniref:choice-of-anchor H family protein n=1 Tax=Thalassotalea aquiviva TaxID=3242415 RepID=UPI00352B1C65